MGGFSLDVVGDVVKIVVGEPHVVVHLSQGPPVPETGMRVSNMNTTATATAKTTAKTTANRLAYLNHWIRLNSAAPNAADIATNALRGVRVDYSLYSRKMEEHQLVMPDGYLNHGMSPIQLTIARKIAHSFGHLWASFNTAFEWADHYNLGREDGWNSSNHPLPTPADVSASGRYKWTVNRIGAINFEVNRPSGTACRVNGTLDNFVITITKLALDRHLKCLHQQLVNVFGLTSEESIERIETAKGFNLMGIRGGELHKVLAE